MTPQVLLARLATNADTAVPALRALGVWDDEGPTADAEALVDALADSPDPPAALTALARLAERRAEAWEQLVATGNVERAIAVAGASGALGELLVTLPGAAGILGGDLDEAWDVAEVRARIERTLVGAEPAAALVLVQRCGLLRVAARDVLGLAATPQVAAELADLAQAIIAAALEVTRAGSTRVRLAVIGMGKLGGRELNYVSDVDVLFVHDGDLQDALRWAGRFLRLLSEATPYGRIYEVDANLRPEGKDGPLSRSLASFAAYYERWAKTWEFQALLKARPVGGDAALGEAFSRLAEPFVWPDRLAPGAVEEIQRMKGVVESSTQVRRAGAREVKLAPGGLRDIEFAVQLLQLVHGRHDPTLRSPNTLDALTALADGGYVGEEDAGLFSRAYVFLRTVEHRLQLAHLRRTHTLPEDEIERDRLARTLGYRAHGPDSAGERFDADVRRVQADVRQVHAKLFYRPLLVRFAEVGVETVAPVGDAVRAAGLDDEAAIERLAALGFRDARRALAHLGALASGVTRRARLFRTLLPAILPTLAAAPDPDGGLAALRSLAERLGDAHAFLHAVRDNPPVADLLASVLGRSRVVGEWLERQPDVVGHLADLGWLDGTRTSEDYCRLADGLIRRGLPGGAKAAEALRRVRRRELARTALRDLSGRADVAQVAGELSGQAEACLHAGLGLVGGDVRMAVIGLGKLGGRELGYASDLDVLLVFDPPGALDEALSTAESLLRVLSAITPEGQAFRVDLGLRPEGKDGPLARSLESYRAYYERWAQPWELQALTQARPVAGDAELGAAFVDAVARCVYPPAPPPGRLTAVRKMKARVERERGGRADGWVRRTRTTATARSSGARDDRINVKLGAGGLSDVEWTVQLLQLAHGGQDETLRVPGARPALAALARAGLLEPQDAVWLRDGVDMLMRVRNTLYLAGFRDTVHIPGGAQELERLARTLGYDAPGSQAMLEDVRRTMRRVRKVHERYFYDA